MKQSLKQKVQKYRKQKSNKASFQNRIAQATNNLQKILKGSEIQNSSPNKQSQNNQTRKPKNNGLVDFKQKQYLGKLQQLHELKVKAIELSNQLKQIQIEVKFQDQNLNKLNRQYQSEQQRYRNLVGQIEQKNQAQLKQSKKIHEQRVGKTLSHIESLLVDKQKANSYRQDFLRKKKQFQERMKRMQQNYLEQLQNSKRKWAQEDKTKREKWQQKRIEQIKATTLRGIEPNIQRIVKDCKKQMQLIENGFQVMKDQYRQEQTKQYEGKVKVFKQEASLKSQRQKQQILENYSRKIQQQYDRLQVQYEQERQKMRYTYQQEIRQLERRRKQESDEFIQKNKNFYVQHIRQMRQIKQKYQSQISELDGAIKEGVQKQEIQLTTKLQIQYNQNVQQEKNKLRTKLQNYRKQVQQQNEQKYTELVDTVAFQNNKVESQMQLQTQNRIKEQRSKHQNEIKNLRKTIKALQLKIASVTNQKSSNETMKQQVQQEYLQEERQNKYMMKQLVELQRNLQQLKLEQDSYELRQFEQVRKVEIRWEEQFRSLNQQLEKLDQQIQTTAKVMIEQMQENEQNRLKQINAMENEAIKLNARRQEEIARLKMEKVKLQQLGQSYKQALIKQTEIEKKYRNKS